MEASVEFIKDTGRAVNKKGISSGGLKLIAIITMLIDHIGAAVFEMALIPQSYTGGITSAYILYTNIDLALRLIGRIAFPIFCFLIVEGFYHTRSVKRYALRLAVFALLSEIPFDLAFHHQVFYWGYQSVYITLLIGLLVITGMSYCRGKKIWQILIPAAGIALAFLLRTDYYGFGVLLIVFFYAFREMKIARILSCALNFIALGGLEPAALISFIPIHFYNGKKGPAINKYVFYAFYPVHLLILYLIASYILR